MRKNDLHKDNCQDGSSSFYQEALLFGENGLITNLQFLAKIEHQPSEACVLEEGTRNTQGKNAEQEMLD